MTTSSEIHEITKALAAARPKFASLSKSREAKIESKSGAKFSYKYADLADVLDSIVPALAEHGLTVMQPTSFGDGVLMIKTVLAHESGQWIASDYPVCSINGDHKAMGSAMTYARRYALTSLLGIMADDDTDGEGAAKVEKPARQISTQPENRQPASKEGFDPAEVRTVANMKVAVQNCLNEADLADLWSRNQDFRKAYKGLSSDEYREQINVEFKTRKAAIIEAATNALPPTDDGPVYDGPDDSDRGNPFDGE